MAPEIFQEAYDSKIDCYALGIVLLEMSVCPLSITTVVLTIFNRLHRGQFKYIYRGELPRIEADNAALKSWTDARKIDWEALNKYNYSAECECLVLSHILDLIVVL